MTTRSLSFALLALAAPLTLASAAAADEPDPIPPELLNGPSLATPPEAAAPTAAAAQVPPTPPPPRIEPPLRWVPSDFPRLVLDSGRAPVTPADADHVRLQIHGEYQLRWQGMTSFTLTPSASVLDRQPRATGDSIGQNNFLWHWLRVTPRLQIKENIEIVAQADIGGLVLGDVAHDTFADQTPRDEYNGFKNLQPRWLYLEWKSPIGLFRVGQQPSHWGMGILANDGDHPSLFGDYRYGSISESILFATKPGGKESDFVVAVAGSLVFRDSIAQLTRGDHAFQGILAAFYERGPNQIGVYGVYRHQSRDRTSGSDLFPYADTIDVGVVDVAGRFAAPIVTPGIPSYVFGSAEVAAILGSTNGLRTAEQAASGKNTLVRQYGGAVAAGIVVGSHRPMMEAGPDRTARPDLFGKLVTQIEIGYASGDADPNDGVEKRFVFDPNHKVGLLLFDEVMRWQTARASSAAQDPLLANASRPTPGVDLLPSNGGIFGAQYVYPTMLYRPRHWLDLKSGLLVAQTTADLVDPYRYAATPHPKVTAPNFQGGDSARHDLGVEVDLGFEARIALDHGVRLQLGAQGGVLFPGNALADENGAKMKTPWIAIARAGLQF